MLFKKTLRVALATALWMVALLGANSAMAQIRTYSAETLMGAGPAYPIEYGAAVSASAQLGPRARFHLNADNDGTVQRFIRVARTGVLVFRGAPTAHALYSYRPTVGTTATVATCMAAAGTSLDDTPTPVNGAMGSGWVYDVPATLPTTTAPDNCETPVSLVGVQVNIADQTADPAHEFSVLGLGSAGVQVSVYGDEEDAIFADGAPYDGAATSATFITVARSVTVASATAATGPVTNTASAESRFTDITGFEARTTPYEVNLGGFNITVNAMHYDASTGATLPADADGSMAMARWTAVGLRTGATAHGSSSFESPGGWGFAAGFRLADGRNCAVAKGPDGSAAGAVTGNGAGIMSSPLSETGATTDVVGGIKEAAWYLCASMAHDNDEAIPAGFYTLDVNLTQPPGSLRAFPPQSRAVGAVGRIRHDGTTVHIPFVTSYDGYTQRIVIVNRNKVDVSYSITFRTEGDGTLMGDNPHSGMAMGSQATVLKVADLVTLTNPTRGSATVTVAAKPSTIDVATTMVNKMDQATDTVVLEAEEN